MTIAFVEVSGKCAALCGCYGPFDSEEAARVSLTNKGWTRKLPIETEIWIVKNGRFHGVEARILPLRSVKGLQMNVEAIADPYRLVREFDSRRSR